MYYSRLAVICNADYAEILMAEISQAGFDSFMETEDGFEAFAELENFDNAILTEIKERYADKTTLSFSIDRIEKKNWNDEWEKSYEPIIVEDKCLIRASFHKIEKQYPYEIVITPKMSFGTGHHQTTYLMIKNQMTFDHKGKRVMDAGCGTAILSIMASKLGAAAVEAFDIDDWSVINGNENIAINKCNNINLQQGTINQIEVDGEFDIVLANINKNVLLDELKLYQKYLSASGVVLLSGFYLQDVPDLLTAARQFKLKEVLRDEREGWAALLLQKQ